MAKTTGLGAAYRKAGPYLSLGVEFTVTIILCFVLGRWLDGKFETTPVIALVGFLLGSAGAMMNLLRSVNRLHERGKADKDAG